MDLRRAVRAMFGPSRKTPEIRSNPQLDEIVEQIDECITDMMHYGWNNVDEEKYAAAAARKRELEEVHGTRLLAYLEPYDGLDIKNSSEVSTIEWYRYRVRRNWGKYEGA